MTDVSTGPITGSTKIYQALDGVPGARVPFRRVNLSNGEHLDLYDTSGPYTDPDCGHRSERGAAAAARRGARPRHPVAAGARR